MAGDSSETPREPGWMSKALGAVGIFGLLKAMESRGLDDLTPSVLMHTKRSEELRERAFRLVKEGRVDRAAVHDLVTAAGSHRKDLRRAAASIRSDGYVDEDEDCHLANRLLLAAATGEPLKPLSEAERKWFGEIWDLHGAPTDVAFAKLASLDPALIELEASLHREVNGQPFRHLDEEGRHEALTDLLYNRLAPLQERASEPLVRTMLAWYVIRDHLFELAGVRL